MRVAGFLAFRFLRQDRAQTATIIVGVGIGVAVLVFLSALIAGLQASLIAKTLGTQPHVVLRPPDDRPRPLRAAAEPAAAVEAQIEIPPQRLRSIDGWQAIIAATAARPDVVAVSPMASGPALAIRGGASKSVAVLGVDPVQYDRVVPLRARLVAGDLDLSGTDAAIGAELAADLGVRVGDRIRLQNAAGDAELFTVRGVFALGNRDLDERWCVVSLRNAQTLLGVATITSIDVRLARPFDADRVAAALAARTGLHADSWMATNAELLTALRSQSQSSVMIQVFVVIAVAMGIISVLVVSVVQKQREIGILRAMGAPRGRIRRVFLIQGAVLGLGGAAIGCVVGGALATAFSRLATSPDGAPLFPVDLTPRRFALATAVALLTGLAAAVVPAWRAARLDPATAIRHE